MLIEKIISWIKSFFQLFSNQKQQSNSGSSTAFNRTDQSEQPQQHVTYSANLIDDLKQDHENLLQSYVEIQGYVESRDYAQVVACLGQFKDDFNRHLMQENVKFYAYFEQNFSADSPEHLTIKSYRKDMNQIAYAVIKFLKKWTLTEDLNEQSSPQFLEEYQSIANALVQRISDEERELYALYRSA